LYIRPTLIGTEAFLGVRPAEEYLFFVILSPVSSYYGEGSKPIKIWVEEEYLRAAPGGLGATKAAGLGATKAAANYAASLKAALEAKKKSYAQVLWLDVSREYVEEVGTMNVFFVFDNEIVTPALDGTILGGGVRDSIVRLLKSWKLPIVERKVKLQEIREASQQGRLREIFGTGTAAVISPVGELAARDWHITINNNETGPVATRLYDELTGIQNGSRPDSFGWLTTIG
jgi:branched-chain amino acid aminotransferase